MIKAYQTGKPAMGLIHVDTSDLRDVARKLAEVDPKLRTILRRELQKAGEGARDTIRGEASWSERIPPATTVKVYFGARTQGVAVVTSVMRAPEARPLDHGGRGGFFRHPVFANGAETRQEWTWVSQKARPFFEPGADKYERTGFDARVEAIAEDVAIAAGFH